MRKDTTVFLSLNKDWVVNLAVLCRKYWRFFDTIPIN